MKCIKNISTGRVIRTTESDAERMVKSESWYYVPKSEFKAQQKQEQEKGNDSRKL
jgi:hypothetical protein